MVFSLCFFFFSSRRRHTRCSRDWSSDVCSSDLGPDRLLDRRCAGDGAVHAVGLPGGPGGIGRASCREKSVDLGGRRIIKKKKKKKKNKNEVIKKLNKNKKKRIK